MERFGERIKESLMKDTYVVTIPIKFPKELATAFDTFCKQEAGDCYWLGIKQLLDKFNENNKEDIRSKLMFDKMNELEGKLIELTQELEVLKTPKQEVRAFKTFGRQNIEG